MGASSQQFSAFVAEQLAPLGEVNQERFFGGLGLKFAGVFFGMLMDDELYFVVDDVTRPAYETLGSHCFSYDTKKGRVEVKRFFSVPVEAIEEQDRIVALAKVSIAVAQTTTKATKQPSKTVKQI